MANTVLSKPGDVVVPLATILDQLRGKLTSNEVDALIAAVVGGRRTQVAPGDLITSELMNRVLGEMADLQARVTLLEGSSTGGLTLLGFLPDGDVQVGTLLTVIGSGFNPATGATKVKLGSVEIKEFMPGATSNQLVFGIPDLFTGLPRLVECSVEVAGRSSNTRSLRLLARDVVQGGQVVIGPQTATLPQIAVGTTLNLRWLVDSQTALPASYSFSLQFTDVVGATLAAWQNAARVTPATPTPIVRGNPQTVTATVVVPAGATSAQLALRAASSDGLLVRTSAPTPLVVGSTPVVSDPRASVLLPGPGDIGPFDPAGNPNPLRAASISTATGNLDGIQLRFGSTGTLPLTLAVSADNSAAGDYLYSAQIETPGAAWSVLAVTPVNGHTNVAAGNQRSISVRFQNTDANASATVTYMVVRAEHRPTGSNTPSFVSFARFPIQGYTN